MKIQRNILFLAFLGFAGAARPLELAEIQKIDAHVHINTKKPGIIKLAQTEGFKLFTLVTQSSDLKRIESQRQFARFQQEKYVNVLGWATTFYMGNWSGPDWESETIKQLAKDFKNGAVAVKVWKDIGMTFRDERGHFIMIDHPALGPVFDFIAGQKIPLVAHCGEPRNCWLPLDSMTVNSDRNYFKEHPQYHMYLHPDYPSYEDQIEARDNMLAKHPHLRVIGAHLASLEWDVDQLAIRLDRFPNLAVDTAARICHFQVQNREKVRKFIIKYQDRILYGTDIGINEKSGPSGLEYVKNVWQKDWTYFTTDSVMASDQVNKPFKGLDLPRNVVEKIYYENALKWYPGLGTGQSSH